MRLGDIVTLNCPHPVESTSDPRVLVKLNPDMDSRIYEPIISTTHHYQYASLWLSAMIRNTEKHWGEIRDGFLKIMTRVFGHSFHLSSSYLNLLLETCDLMYCPQKLVLQ